MYENTKSFYLFEKIFFKIKMFKYEVEYNSFFQNKLTPEIKANTPF